MTFKKAHFVLEAVLVKMLIFESPSLVRGEQEDETTT